MVIIALFDCGCEHEASPSDTLMVRVSDKEFDDVIVKLKVQSAYDQCEPRGYTEYYIVNEVQHWTSGNPILSYEQFNRIWSERYIIGIVYRYWQSKYQDTRTRDKAYDIMLKYYALGDLI